MCKNAQRRCCPTVTQPQTLLFVCVRVTEPDDGQGCGPKLLLSHPSTAEEPDKNSISLFFFLLVVVVVCFEVIRKVEPYPTRPTHPTALLPS